jgi:hypothetical protein
LDVIRTRYDVDGVVITPEDGEVVYGRHMTMFKLKPFGGRAAHTVDFLVLDDAGTLGVFDAGTHVAVAKLASPASAVRGSVVECALHADGVWAAVGLRTDKKTANDMLTYRKTMLNIRENLSMNDIFDLVSS